MTTLNIPSSPSTGATYEANGVVYTWDGTKWKADSSNVSNLNGGQLAGFRNQLINGDFSIVQRGAAGEASVSRKYTCDHWYVHNDVAATYTWDQIDAPASFKAAGFTKALRVRNASTIFQVRQLVELSAAGERGQFVEGSTWTASIYSDAALDCKVQWRDDSTGTPGAVTDIVPWTTMTQEGDRYTLTFTMPATAPQATALALGISFQRTDGTTSSLKVTGAQFEPGPVATPFEHRPMATELALCQRYYYQVSNTIMFYTYDPSSDAKRRTSFIPSVPMRTNPTFTTLGGGTNSGGGVLYGGTPEFFDFRITNANTGSQSYTDGFSADAEL